MFGEKEKRKEKPKNSDIDSKVMKWVLVTIILGISAFLASSFLFMTVCLPEPQEPITLDEVRLTATALQPMFDTTITQQADKSEQGQ